MAKSPTKADKAARDKLHSQRRLAERRCVTGHIVRHPDRRSTRAAPRAVTYRPKKSHLSNYDKTHKKIFVQSAGEETRAAEAQARLRARERGMLKGYWSDSNPLNWKYGNG